MADVVVDEVERVEAMYEDVGVRHVVLCEPKCCERDHKFNSKDVLGVKGWTLHRGWSFV
jgi:hypothetical protein